MRLALFVLALAVAMEALGADSQTPAIVDAAKRNCMRCVTVLLDAGARVDARALPSGDTALHAAAAQDAHELVELLAGRGAEMNPVNVTGETPLHVAARRASPATLNALLARGANVEAWSGEGTPLLSALRATSNSARHSNVVVLLGAKANPGVRDRHGDTALHLAVARGDTRCVEALLRAGAHVDVRNVRGETPANLAERLRRADLLEALRSAAVRRPL
jgi:ankyrin repeat protein